MRTVLFDLDGTLLDTRESIMRAFAFALGQFGVPIAPETLAEHFGRPIRDAYQRLVPSIEPERLMEAHREHQTQHMHLVAPFPGVEQTLSDLRKRNCTLGVVTNRMRRSAEAYLAHTALADHFETLVAWEDVENKKPHPEGIRKALATLDAQPSDTLFVGDTTYDIAAGKAAGVFTAGVTYGHEGEALAESNPDFLLRSFEDVLRIAG